MLYCKVKICKNAVFVVYYNLFLYHICEDVILMGKWIGRFLYAIIIIYMTFVIIQSANGARSNAYLLENMSEYYNDETQFFKGVNTLLGLDYITYEPIAPVYTDTTREHRLTFQIYGIGYTDQEGIHLDGMMIFVNDVVIYEKNEETGFYKLLENPYIRLTIFTDELQENSTEPVSYTSVGMNFSAGFVFDQVSSEVAYDLTKTDGSLAKITRVDVDYSNGATNADGSLIYSPESIMIVASQPVDDPVFDDSIKITDFNYDPESYRLSDDITTWPVTDAEASTLNLMTDHDDITAYNWHMIRVYLLYAGFVIIVTYLLFFHKKVMGLIHTKRTQKNKDNDIETESVDDHLVEQIFKDPEYREKDGK